MSATRLHIAAFDGDDDAINRLLSEGADIDSRTDRGETPLMFAAMQGHTAVVRTLLKRGADVNLLPSQGQSALRRAVQGGHADVVHLLLKQGADPEAVVPLKPPTEEKLREAEAQFRKYVGESREQMASVGGEASPLGVFEKYLKTAVGNLSQGDVQKPSSNSKRNDILRRAILSGSAATLEALMEAGISPGSLPKEKLPDLLSFARDTTMSLEMVRLLLRYGADPSGNGDGPSPLAMAIVKSDLPFARILIEFGARTDSTNIGLDLLSLAVTRENREMIDLLLKHDVPINETLTSTYLQSCKDPEIGAMIAAKRGTDWFDKVQSGDVAGVRAALKNGAVVNVVDPKMGTALYIAAGKNDADMIRLLLNAGADVGTGMRDMTPLHVAAKNGAADAIRLLLESGASPTAETRFGMTPLLMAAINGKTEAADLLASNGAVIGVVEAILLRRAKAVSEFWSRGTPVTYANEAGMTPLHAAAQVGDIDLVTTLLSLGAAINAIDRVHRTPLSVAVHQDNEVIARLLLDHGASPTTVSKLSPPLESAATRWNEPMVRLLLERGAPLEVSALSSTKGRAEEKRGSHIIESLLMIHRGRNAGQVGATIPQWRDVDRLWATLRTLIEFGADVNSQDIAKNPLLLSLIELDAPSDLIRIVIDKGAEINAIGVSGRTPLMTAIEKGRADVVETLLARSANPNGGTNSSCPLQAARAANRDDLVMLLEKHGASDEKRETLSVGFDGIARGLLRTARLSGSNPIAEMKFPDFAQLNMARREQQAQKIADRRKALEAEVLANEAAGGALN